MADAKRQAMRPTIGPRTEQAGLMKKYGIPKSFQLSTGWNMWKQTLIVMSRSRQRNME